MRQLRIAEVGRQCPFRRGGGHERNGSHMGEPFFSCLSCDTFSPKEAYAYTFGEPRQAHACHLMRPMLQCSTIEGWSFVSTTDERQRQRIKEKRELQQQSSTLHLVPHCPLAPQDIPETRQNDLDVPASCSTGIARRSLLLGEVLSYQGCLFLRSRVAAACRRSLLRLFYSNSRLACTGPPVLCCDSAATVVPMHTVSMINAFLSCSQCHQYWWYRLLVSLAQRGCLYWQEALGLQTMLPW
jgi:hypothetical protein